MCMMSLIDSQFDKSSPILKYMFVVYFVFFAVPFIVQAFLTEYKAVLGTNLSCLVTQLILMVVECIQMSYAGGIRKYLCNVWNYFDITHFVLYVIYFAVRISTWSSDSIVPSSALTSDTQDKIYFWVVFHTLLLILIAFKLMFFMRVSDNFASLVKLVGDVLGKVGPFIVFFIMWLITLSLLYKVAGINIENEDYKRLDKASSLVIQNFRNAIGDINAPSADDWFSDDDDTISEGQRTMLYWGWLLFLFNEFFNLIVLLNFLIAIISQSYDEVMGRELINRYQSRCSINLEIALLIDAIKYKHASKSVANNTMLYLSANTAHENGENEFQGFVKSIKQALKRENRQLKEELKKLSQEQLTELSKKIDETKSSQEVEMKEMN